MIMITPASFFAKKPHERLRAEINRVLRQFDGGVHRSGLIGAGVEFKGLRPYSPFDPPTAIDDLASARFSEESEFEPFSRMKYEKKQISVLVFIDVGVTMAEPPVKREYAARLFWLFALSTFSKTYDRFRTVPFSVKPLYDSDWVRSEEALEEFLARLTLERPRPKFLRFPDIFSYCVELNLYDSLVVIISDFCWPWNNEPTALRRIGLAERNVKMLFCVLDEWEGFVSTGYGAEICDIRTGTRRYATDTELIQMKDSASRHLAAIQESIRPLGIPLLTFSLLEDPLHDIRKRLLRLLGFQ